MSEYIDCGTEQEKSAIPKMITVPELQEQLAIGQKTAYNLVKRKDFPSVKLGKEYRIFIDKLPAWLEKQQKIKKA